MAKIIEGISFKLFIIDELSVLLLDLFFINCFWIDDNIFVNLASRSSPNDLIVVINKLKSLLQLFDSILLTDCSN